MRGKIEWGRWTESEESDRRWKKVGEGLQKGQIEQRRKRGDKEVSRRAKGKRGVLERSKRERERVEREEREGRQREGTDAVRYGKDRTKYRGGTEYKEREENKRREIQIGLLKIGERRDKRDRGQRHRDAREERRERKGRRARAMGKKREIQKSEKLGGIERK